MDESRHEELMQERIAELEALCRNLAQANEDLSVRLARATDDGPQKHQAVPLPVLAPGEMVLTLEPGGDEELSAELHLGGGIREVLDALPFYVVLVDETHHIVLANRVFREAVGGGSGADICGQYCPRFVHGAESPLPYCPVEAALRTGQGVQIEHFDEATGAWLMSGAFPIKYSTPAGKRVFFHFVMDITERKVAEEEALWGRKTHEALADLLTLSFSPEDLSGVLQQALERLFHLDWLSLTPKGAIFLMGDDGDTLRMAANHNLAQPLLEMCREVRLGHCMCGRAAQEAVTVFSSNLDERHDVSYEGMQEHGHYCIPIAVDNTVLGVLNLYLEAGHRRVEKEELFLRSVCDVLGGIIRHRHAEELVQASAERLRANLDGTVKAVSAALEARDPYTAGHMQRVTRLAVEIARHMGMGEVGVDVVRLAAGMHDIGKLQVPAEILSKPGRLSAAEFALIQTHSQVGYDILKDIDFAAPVATIIQQHHEKLDGSGYPQGLKGDQILLEARILAAADVVEAVASHRPYRPALGIAKALDILDEGSGTHFDPAVVTACLQVFQAGYEL